MQGQRVIDAWLQSAGRRYVNWPILIFDTEDRRLPAVLSELTDDGAQVLIEQRLDAGEQIVLVHDELGEMTAEVRWWTAGRAGLRFEDPI